MGSCTAAKPSATRNGGIITTRMPPTALAMTIIIRAFTALDITITDLAMDTTMAITDRAH
jgi:hypothetical protein